MILSSHPDDFVADRDDIQRDTAAGNIPVWYGEWSLATQFNATDEFLCKWADAQKLMYSQGAGWLVRLSRLGPIPLDISDELN